MKTPGRHPTIGAHFEHRAIIVEGAGNQRPWPRRSRGLEVGDATESDRAAAVQPWPHHQELGSEVCRAGPPIHIPVRSLRGEPGSSTDNAEPRATVAALTFR